MFRLRHIAESASRLLNGEYLSRQWLERPRLECLHQLTEHGPNQGRVLQTHLSQVKGKIRYITSQLRHLTCIPNIPLANLHEPPVGSLDRQTFGNVLSSQRVQDDVYTLTARALHHGIGKI